MHKRILDLIFCPKCKIDLKLDIFLQEEGRIKEGILTCLSCNEIYPIVDFIPRIIEGILREYPDFSKRYKLIVKNINSPNTQLSSLERLSKKSKESFGYQWTRTIFSKVISKFEDDFLNYVYPLKKEFFQAKLGVDIGCGFGRHIYYAAQFGSEMVGIDFSNAIDSAYTNTKGLNNAHLIQADIYNLPLKKSNFDFVYSIGVLHHLPNPEKGFNAILPLLKPGGHVSIWVYSKSRPLVNFVIESIRLTTKRMPHGLLYILCIILTFLEYALIIMPYKLLKKIKSINGLLDKITLRRIKIYSEYPFSVISADWFDRLSAPVRYYYNEKDLEDWFRRARLLLIKTSPTGAYGWRALGQKQT